MSLNTKKIITKKVYHSLLKPAAVALVRMRHVIDEIDEIMPEAMLGKVQQRRDGFKKMREIRNLADSGLKSFKATDPWYRDNVNKFRSKKKAKDDSESKSEQ